MYVNVQLDWLKDWVSLITQKLWLSLVWGSRGARIRRAQSSFIIQGECRKNHTGLYCQFPPIPYTPFSDTHMSGVGFYVPMFHITQLKKGYFISNRYGCLGDVKQIPKKGHLPTPVCNICPWNMLKPCTNQLSEFKDRTAGISHRQVFTSFWVQQLIPWTSLNSYVLSLEKKQTKHRFPFFDTKRFPNCRVD